MKIGIVGCGFVADYYLKTLPRYPLLDLIGVFDCDFNRAHQFAKRHGVSAYRSLEELLEEDSIKLIVNLTNPKSHFWVSKTCLEANKNVYSEKPLAMNFFQAKELVELAEQQGLYLSCAPCNLLSETAQTIGKILRENQIGKVFAVYAELDDGLIHRMPYHKWLSESGIPWPYKDEFEVGCTIEHAAYYVTWLTAFFGPALEVTAFSSCQIVDKKTELSLDNNAPDFSVACIKFASGVVARLTCSIIAPHDHSLTIVGEEGIIYTKDCWYYKSPVYIKRRLNIRRKSIINPWKFKYPLVGKSLSKSSAENSQQMDYSRGIAELAAAITEQRPCRLSARFALHINEIVLAINNADKTNGKYKILSSFEPIQPMDWAKT